MDQTTEMEQREAPIGEIRVTPDFPFQEVLL